jgi:hypothetical protein
MGSREKGVLFLVLGFIIALANMLQVLDAQQLVSDGTPSGDGYVAGRITAIVLFWGLAIYLVWKGRKLYKQGE